MDYARAQPVTAHPVLATYRYSPPTGPGLEAVSTALDKRSSQSWKDAVFDASIWTPGERIRYEVVIPVWDEGDVLDGMKLEDMPSEVPHMRVLVSLPQTYPNSAPQLQLLGRYMGSFGIDAGLCKSFLRSLFECQYPS